MYILSTLFAEFILSAYVFIVKTGGQQPLTTSDFTINLLAITNRIYFRGK